jgi:putative redox protein
MEVIVRHGAGKLQQIIDIGPHRILSDAPKAYGGEESGPGPHDLLAAALGACTALTVTMYAQRKGMDLQDIEVRIEHGQHDGIYMLTRHIRYIGGLRAEERERLTDIANKCPVHKTLTGTIEIITQAN